ncbi:hypothetical protein [Polaromonas naphthalenivorans]|uniref:Uncharacterized protein n=1 Tax=Polaromonas naphthalenivorans (strain CJ2) TaxID=365044 RepID=A1VWZ1_POLNA|nr:hypothetical protein [Polaromonas naphthalenivorans]ABM40169.1 hypothetical protein Pnap_4760 [Polaromonas naphthalenivorans CJ2]
MAMRLAGMPGLPREAGRIRSNTHALFGGVGFFSFFAQLRALPPPETPFVRKPRFWNRIGSMPRKNPSRNSSSARRRRVGVRRTHQGYRILTPNGTEGLVAHGISLKAIHGLMKKLRRHMTPADSLARADEPPAGS